MITNYQLIVKCTVLLLWSIYQSSAIAYSPVIFEYNGIVQQATARTTDISTGGSMATSPEYDVGESISLRLTWDRDSLVFDNLSGTWSAALWAVESPFLNVTRQAPPGTIGGDVYTWGPSSTANIKFNSSPGVDLQAYSLHSFSAGISQLYLESRIGGSAQEFSWYSYRSGHVTFGSLEYGRAEVVSMSPIPEPLSAHLFTFGVLLVAGTSRRGRSRVTV